ncbi:MAG: hydrogenase maturation protease [Armatimonadota bacterium]
MLKILILGLGNDILCDDGIGIKLAKDLQREFSSYNYEFLPASIDGIALLDVMDGYDKVIILDAFQTKDIDIGEVAVLGIEDLKHTVFIGSPHSINLATALKMSEKLNYNIPEDIVIIAINVFDVQTFAEELSSEIQSQYPQILKKVREIIKDKVNL